MGEIIVLGIVIAGVVIITYVIVDYHARKSAYYEGYWRGLKEK